LAVRVLSFFKPLGIILLKDANTPETKAMLEWARGGSKKIRMESKELRSGFQPKDILVENKKIRKAVDGAHRKERDSQQ